MKIKLLLVTLIMGFFLWLLPVTTAVADHETENFDYLIGVDPIHGPAISMASNGDIIEVMGQGTLSIHPKSVTGGGTLVHKDASGNVVGTGTWTATKLLSFRSWGTQEGVPENFEGGRALIRVHLVPDGGGEGFDGMLKVVCLIGNVPSGAHEGIRLWVRGGPNFREEVSGDTLFIRTN